MKLVSLNTWGGKMFDPLMDFVRKHAENTDIFCFQEIYKTSSNFTNYHDVRVNIFFELTKILPNFQTFYTSEFEGFDSCPDRVDFDLTVGEAIFTKKTIQIIDQGDLLIFGDRTEKILKKDFSNLPVSLQYISFSVNNKFFTICSFHGTAFPGSKLDTPIRLKQSSDILNFLQNKSGEKIITGDFNLMPQTQSIKMLEEKYKNLIKEFHIEKTRSNLSPYAGKIDFQKFADYTFVSKDINVTGFEVPNLEISDHLPMILDFS